MVYGESPFGPLPDSFEAPHHKFFGPYYLVEMSSGDLKVLNIAVSAYNQDIGLDAERLVLPKVFGNDFIPIGISVELPFGVPTSPEVAARQVAVQSGALVDAVPVFELPGHFLVPQFGRWRITLDRSVPVRATRTKELMLTAVVYADFRGTALVATAEQPRFVAARSGDMTFPLREGAPIDFEPVELLRSRP